MLVVDLLMVHMVVVLILVQLMVIQQQVNQMQIQMIAGVIIRVKKEKINSVDFTKKNTKLEEYIFK